jgi:hypothetical protein
LNLWHKLDVTHCTGRLDWVVGGGGVAGSGGVEGGQQRWALTDVMMIRRFAVCVSRELRQYLDEGGVLDAWAKCLVALYQEKEKPEQPIE